MDLKLKDILGYIKTSQPIQLESVETYEISDVSYSELKQYEEFYVTEIRTTDCPYKSLVISIKSFI